MNSAAASPTYGPGLYVHVPFCLQKCHYCDFVSGLFHEEDVAQYLAALCRELRLRDIGLRFRTIYLGGGTPTALPDAALDQLLDVIAQHVRLGDIVEWTCEANPGTLTMCKAHRLRQAGVNRLSVGAQSFNEQHLRTLGRIHRVSDIIGAVRIASEAGFRNIGLDLIYAIPGQTLEDWIATVDACLQLGPNHISIYALSIESGTPFAAARAAGMLGEIEDELQSVMYYRARERLMAAGYRHYEISNFARPGSECRHNLLYWSAGNYIGVGPSAHSHWLGWRWANWADQSRWIRAMTETPSGVAHRDQHPPRSAPDTSPGRWAEYDGSSPPDIAKKPPICAAADEFVEWLDARKRARETLVLGLRRIDGWTREEFKEVTGFDYEELCGPEIDRLAAEGLLVRTADGLRLHEQALFISDSVFRELV